MSTDAYDWCSRAIRALRFNWTQNPKVMLKLQTVGSNYDYLQNDPELFEVFCNKLYRKLNKKYRGLLDLIVPAHFIWQTKIMRSMLKGRPTNGQTYERIKSAIIIPHSRKSPILKRMVVDVTPTPLKNLDFTCKSLLDLKHSEKENKILQTLGVLQRIRLTWKRSPTKILREKLWVVGLKLDVFEENSILFTTLKQRLGRKFQAGEFRKYHTFIESINQKDFRWRVNTIWEVLFNIKPEGCYWLLGSLLHI